VDWAMNLTGRLLLAALFLAGAVQKVADPAAAQALLSGVGLQVWLIWPAALLDGALAVGILAGPLVRASALVAAVYCMATSVFHFIPEDGWQMSIFVKNWAIAGGLLVLASQPLPRRRT